MDDLNSDERLWVYRARAALQSVSTEGASIAVFNALQTCAPIKGGFIGTFAKGGIDAIVSHAVGLPQNVIEGWFDAPREQLELMLTPLLKASAGQLISDGEAMIGRMREQIDLLRIMPAAGLGEAAGYMVSDPEAAGRRLTFLTFALDEKAKFTDRDRLMLGYLRADIHAALARAHLPFISSQSVIAQIVENRTYGFVLVNPKNAQCIEMNLRARELVTQYAASARVEPGKYVVSSFAVRALFETRGRDVWITPHPLGLRELEVTVHELKKEDHAIGEDMWLVMMKETEIHLPNGMFTDLGLTTREEEIAVYLVETGLSIKEIADRLGTSYNTVRTQVATIFRKCGVRTRAELSARLKARRPS